MAQSFVSTAPVPDITKLLQNAQDERTNDNTLRSTFQGDSFPENPVKGQQAYVSGKTYRYDNGWEEIDNSTSIGIEVKNARGVLSSLYARLGVSLNDDGTLKVPATTNVSEWISNSSLSPVFVSNSSFKVAEDYTGVFTNGRAIKAVSATNGTKYSHVASSSYEAATRVTTVVLTVPILDNTLQTIEYGFLQYSGSAGGSGSNSFFEIDSSGGLMPSSNPVYSDDFILDDNGDIMPK